MARMIPATDQVFAYLVRTGAREHPVLTKCREETARHPSAGMQIGPDQGAVMALLAQLIGARRYLEVGTFTGYSALAVALALPSDGKAICCDVSKEYTDLARAYWEEAGVASKIELRLGPALETLDRIIAEGEPPFDFAFIDADKQGYDAYYERALKLVRSGGLIALDNMLWSGEVADPSNADHTAVTLGALNQKIHDDPRVDMALLAIGDGVMLARKR
ncbi:MAG: class I SAM-dependent methyltransferase [Alphaproteobacteria bacterium]|nr:class I SAM-dependent methyltransferase [Alphaproteobacteria bacterium]